jgi:succinoglycan biosynthesis transport protein ExoP
MEDEIDLRQYLEVLIRRWKWIVALTLVAALVAAAISFFVLEPVYEATAMILVTNPRYQLRFDPRVETLSDIETSSKAYPSLALSDDLLKTVLEVLDSTLPEHEGTLQGLRGKVSASAGADPSLLQLKATNGDPEQAAQVANTWAEQYVEYVNELYGRRSEDVVFFSEQFDAAKSALEAAERALVAYEARNQEAIFQTRLDAKRLALEDYLNAQHELTLVIGDAQVLRKQLAGQPASAPASLSNDLAALLLEIQGLSRDVEMPLQLQVPVGGSLSNKTVGEQASLLNDLVAALVDRSAEIEAQIETLSAEILPLQETLQQAVTEKERLTRAQDVARGTFTTLANKVEEARIAAQDETGDVRLASRASVPNSPVGPRKLMNTALAGFLGLFVGVFAAFFVEYWQSPREEAGA